MENKFYVGQEVLCIKASKYPHAPIKGQKYTVWGIRLCKCGILKLDVGCSTKASGSTCNACSQDTKGGIFWRDASTFIPIDNELSELTSDDILQPQEQNSKV